MNEFNSLLKDVTTYSEVFKSDYNIFNDEFITKEKINNFVDNFLKFYMTEVFGHIDSNPIFLNKLIKHGNQSQYSFKFNNDTFFVDIFYYDKDIILNQLDNNILNGLIISKNTEKLKFLYNFIKNSDKKYVVYLDFFKNDFIKKITNTSGYDARRIIGMVKTILEQELLTNKNILDTICLYMNVDKTEGKRIELYTKLIKSYMIVFKHMYVDDISDFKFFSIYYW